MTLAIRLHGVFPRLHSSCGRTKTNLTLYIFKVDFNITAKCSMSLFFPSDNLNNTLQESFCRSYSSEVLVISVDLFTCKSLLSLKATDNLCTPSFCYLQDYDRMRRKIIPQKTSVTCSNGAEMFKISLQICSVASVRTCSDD